MTRTLRNARYAVFLLLLLASLLAPSALAQGRVPTDDEVNAIARQLYCPVCENVPLDVCPTQACAQWRDLIRLMLSQGKSEEEIKQYFVDNYGARVLNEPPRQGINWLAYLVPPAAILAGVVIVFRALRAWKKPVMAALAEGDAASPLSAPVTEAPADDYIARLEEEVRKRN